MRRFTVSIAAPLADVYDFFADPRCRPEWQSSLRGVEMVDDGEPRPGVRWRDLTTVGMRPLMRITEMRHGVSWAETGQWRGLAADLTLDFVSTSTGTDVTVTAAVRGEGAWRLVALAARPVMPIALRSDVRRAARLLERRAGRG